MHCNMHLCSNAAYLHPFVFSDVFIMTVNCQSPTFWFNSSLFFYLFLKCVQLGQSVNVPVEIYFILGDTLDVMMAVLCI